MNEFHESNNSDSLLSFNKAYVLFMNRLCGLVARVPGYRSRGPGSSPGFSEK
jgi:hypothetical protein